ncbi:MAG TPA: PepSY domain-containing protein [Gammaproteobacteria bacterium]|nr:PepSY domain-containing protein [Gammaproteobacteria bacterium]
MWVFIHKWHRRLGIISALFVILLVITGLLLNHTGVLQLKDHFVQNRLLLNLYNINPAEKPLGFRVEQYWISLIGERLYLDGTEINDGVDNLFGAVNQDSMIVVAFDGQLLLVTPRGQIVERLTDTQGVPAGMRAIGKAADGSLVIRGSHGDYQVNLDNLDWHEENEIDASWSTPSAIPADKLAVLLELYRGKGLPLERVILDLHSGRFLGNWGVYIIDAAAILFLLLAVSGTWMWLQRR